MTGPRSNTDGAIRDEVIVFEHPSAGRVMAVVPVIPDGAPYKVREGITRRRLATLTGRCPCGASFDLAAAARGRGTVDVAEFEHEPRCPAITSRLVKEIRRWCR